MKKWIALLLIVMMTAAGAYAETAEPVFETLASLEWSFMSGAGAWSTDLRIQADGSFSGEYHDSDMGDTGEGYPDGTVYFCSFLGQMSLVEQVDEQTWKLRVDRLVKEDRQKTESIEEGIRFVLSDAYGISEGDEMLLFRPGTPLSRLTEDMLFWTHVQFLDPLPDTLPDWFLYSEKNESGFVGYEVPETVGMGNPWEELTAEELKTASGLSFGIPDHAENILYRYLRNENLAEMQFTLDSDEYCARIQPTVIQEGEWPDISGMYFAWENEEEVTIGSCKGLLGQAQTGSSEWVERCLWVDVAHGLAYSLSVYTTDIDGLDLTAVADFVYCPALETP